MAAGAWTDAFPLSQLSRSESALVLAELVREADLRQPEVENLGVSALADEDVGRLNVAVDDAACARRRVRLRFLSPATAMLRFPADGRRCVLQRHAVEKFHRNECLAFSWSMSWIVQMLGWFSADAACASRQSAQGSAGRGPHLQAET